MLCINILAGLPLLLSGSVRYVWEVEIMEEYLEIFNKFSAKVLHFRGCILAHNKHLRQVEGRGSSSLAFGLQNGIGNYDTVPNTEVYWFVG